MPIAKDKLQHAVVGLAVALFALVIWLVLVQAGLAPLRALPAVLPLATLIAGLSKEGADWFENRARPGSHEVSPLDVLATFVPGLVAGLLAHQVLLTAGA